MGRTALHWAARRGHAACVRALLARGADPQAPPRPEAGPDLTVPRHVPLEPFGPSLSARCGASSRAAVKALPPSLPY